jgi:hypothetical protein
MNAKELRSLIREEIKKTLKESPVRIAPEYKGPTSAPEGSLKGFAKGEHDYSKPAKKAQDGYWSKMKPGTNYNKLLMPLMHKKFKISEDQGGESGILIALGFDNGEQIGILKGVDNDLYTYSSDYLYSLIKGR